ncbi:MAG: hypothetical protein ACQETO_01205 [Pseudomonadota bacterium]
MNVDELRACLQAEQEPWDDPGVKPRDPAPEPERDRLAEIEMAARLGYLLCQCTWPPQIMVMSGDGELFTCPRCRRRRDF